MELRPPHDPSDMRALAARVDHYYQALLAADAPELSAALLAAQLAHGDIFPTPITIGQRFGGSPYRAHHTDPSHGD